jgi:hypothetical protein
VFPQAELEDRAIVLIRHHEQLALVKQEPRRFQLTFDG